MPIRKLLSPLGAAALLSIANNASLSAAQAVLTWDASPNPDVVSYRVRRGVHSGDYNKTFEVGSIPTFTDLNLEAGKVYYYTVSSVFRSGAESPLSSEVSIVAGSAKEPSISSLPDLQLASGSVSGTVKFTVGDSDSPLSSLELKATSSNPSLIPPSLVQFNGSGKERTVSVGAVGGQEGSATVTLEVSDGALSARTSFLVTVKKATRPLPIAGNRKFTVVEDGRLNMRLGSSRDESERGNARIVLGPHKGSLKGTPPALTYIPDPNENGVDFFTYVVTDGQSISEPAVVTIDVTPVNDAPKSEADRVIVVPGGQSAELSTKASSVLENDRDEENDTLSAVLVEGPRHGTLRLTRDGSFVYQHDGSDATEDGFSYRATDGQAFGEVTQVGVSVFRMALERSNDGSISISWPVEAGGHYTVESSLNPAVDDGSWDIDYEIEAASDGRTSTVVAPRSLDVVRYFRVRWSDDDVEFVSPVVAASTSQ